MGSLKDFIRKYNCLKKQFVRQHSLLIPGGRKGYLITNVSDTEVVITQGKTEQKHKLIYLQSLFVDPKSFYGPRNGMEYKRDTRYGHLLMKNAIVDYLEQIEC